MKKGNEKKDVILEVKGQDLIFLLGIRMSLKLGQNFKRKDPKNVKKKYA